MENAKIKKLEPKEWLDRVIDNADQLHILDNALRPEEVTYTCLDVTSCWSEFPQIHLGAENVRFFGALFNLPIDLSTVHYSKERPYVEVSITYRAHHIFASLYVQLERLRAVYRLHC